LNHHLNPTGSSGNHAEPWISLHDRIKPTSKLFKVKNSSPSSKKSKRLLEDEDIRVILPSDQLKISTRKRFYQSIKNPASKEGFTTKYLPLLKARIHQKQINTFHNIASFQSVG
jgi:hypothetical protein